MSIYHYTNGCHLAKIVNEGLIRTSKKFLDKKQKPAAWLTKSPEWDVACNVGIVKDTKKLAVEQDYFFDEVEIKIVDNDYMKKEIGMCRILINESLPVVSWAKFRYVSGIEWNSYYVIDECSKNSGSPVDKWICTFSGIPRKYWEAIEMFVDDQWVRWDEKLPIQEFVDLCLSCNGKQITQEVKINGFPKEHCQNQVDFMKRHNEEIAKLWEANKHKKGYIKIYVTPDYQPYPCGFEFIERRIKKSTFKPLWKSETETYALVHFLWEATFTQYKAALAYNKETDMASYKSICN
jgi:hypothetical protein